MRLMKKIYKTILTLCLLLAYGQVSYGQLNVFQFTFENTETFTTDNAVGTPTFSTQGTLTTPSYFGGSTINDCPTTIGDSRSHAGWNTNDGYRFTVNTTGYSNLNFSVCIRSSSTSVGTFIIRASSDGSTWTTLVTAFTPSITFASYNGNLPVSCSNVASVFVEVFKTNNAGAVGNNIRIDNATLTGFINYYYAGTGNVNTLTNWGTNTDGTGTNPVNFTTAGSIYNMRNATTANMTANWTVSGIGSKVIVGDGTNPITFSIPDGMTVNSTVEVANNAILQTNNTGTVSGVGSFTLASGATLRTANVNGLNCIGVSGTETFATGANYEFNGTAEQTTNFGANNMLNSLTVNNSAGIKLSENITVNGTLTLTIGDLDLNGRNITLNGTLVEDRVNNHIVKDNTATTDANQGGSVIFTSAVNTGTSELKGTGLYLKTTLGAYNVTVNRKHYRGDGASRGGKGIKRIYQITPDAPTNVTSSATEMRIYYANDELADVSAPFVLYRWTSITGWESGSASSAFDDGINGTIPNYIQAINVSAFSHWTVGSSGSAPLPITLLSFEGKRIAQAGEPTESVKLTWATASEINNKGFEIQVSDNAQTFKAVDFIEGRGNSTTVSSYQLVFSNLNDGYYRLKQMDFDGKFSYSPIVFVEGLAGKVLVYPNPNNGTFKVVCGTQTTADKLDLPARLLNAQGVEVWRSMQTEVKTNLPAGVYFLHTVVAGKTKVTKVVIQ